MIQYEKTLTSVFSGKTMKTLVLRPAIAASERTKSHQAIIDIFFGYG